MPLRLTGRAQTKINTTTRKERASQKITEKAMSKVRWKSPRALLCRRCHQRARAVEMCQRLGPKKELQPNRKGSLAQKLDG
eukprot:6837052-Ditylum_brightwellii.AAC.1